MRTREDDTIFFEYAIFQNERINFSRRKISLNHFVEMDRPKHPRTRVQRRRPDHGFIRAVFIREWRENKIKTFNAYFAGIIAEQINKLEASGQASFGEGQRKYTAEVPDLDPVVTNTLEWLGDAGSFDPDTVLSERLEEPKLETSEIDFMMERVGSVCFLSRVYKVNRDRRCYRCEKKWSSSTYTYWSKCIECDAMWCRRCYKDIQQKAVLRGFRHPCL